MNILAPNYCLIGPLSGRSNNGMPLNPSLDIEAPGWALGYSTGGRVWPSASALCRYLSRTDICRGEYIIELGCGAASVGLFAGACGALSVILSDCNKEVLSLAQRNAKANAETLKNLSAISVVQYGWGNTNIQAILPPHNAYNQVLILGSDITYYRETHNALCFTIASLLQARPRSRALIAHQHRRLASFLGGQGQLESFLKSAQESQLYCSLLHVDTSNPTSHISIIEITLKNSSSS